MRLFGDDERFLDWLGRITPGQEGALISISDIHPTNRWVLIVET